MLRFFFKFDMRQNQIRDTLHVRHVGILDTI